MFHHCVKGCVPLTVPENDCYVALWDSVGELGRSDFQAGLSEGAELMAWGSGISKCLWSFVLCKRSPLLVYRLGILANVKMTKAAMASPPVALTGLREMPPKWVWLPSSLVHSWVLRLPV